MYIYNIYCLNQFNLCFWFARKSKKQLVQSQFLVMFLFSSPTSAASNTEVRCKESCAVNMTSTLVSLLHFFWVTININGSFPYYIPMSLKFLITMNSGASRVSSCQSNCCRSSSCSSCAAGINGSDTSSHTKVHVDS